VAVLVTFTFLRYNPNVVELGLFGVRFTLHPVVYALLIVTLVWVSVNVTNCTDGVDGLSGSLALATIMTIYLIDKVKGVSGDFTLPILFFAVCILGYLWHNATPSTLLMGDAGSRGMGLFIGIAILKAGFPLLYVPVAFMLIVDGGLGLVKVFFIKFFKIHLFKKMRFPLHDHVRNLWKWSNTQTVFRFLIIQIIVSAAVIYGISL
jgi:phospho-N-acetylmuramoyl-pentapeptide-transferase